MKNSLWIKFIAVLLCAACLLAALGSGLVLGCLVYTGYMQDGVYDAYLETEINSQMDAKAQLLASTWASREYGKLPEDLASAKLTFSYSWWKVNWEDISYEITDEDGTVLASLDNRIQPVRELSCTFPQLRYQEYVPSSAAKDDDIQRESTRDDVNRTSYSYDYREKALKEPVTVQLSLGADAIQPDIANVLLGYFVDYRNELVIALVAGLLLFAALAVFLCSIAGCKKGSTEVKAGGFSALPLDLYGCILAGLSVCLAYLAALLLDRSLENSIQLDCKAALMMAAGVSYCICVLFVCFCFAFAAQVKMGHGHWYRNSIVGRCIRVALEILRGIFHLIPTLWSFVLRIVKDIFKVLSALAVLLWSWMKKCLTVTGRLLKRCLALCEKGLSLLPLTWQWIVIGGGLVLMLLISMEGRNKYWVVLWGLASLAALLYGANSFGKLLEGAKRMRGGDLESKVEDKYLLGCFREFSEELNGLADVAMEAAQNQLKSERMKTELITNVSHDIKTPLTSIINYVDLLEKPHTPEEAQSYVEVLSRQSHRLKKLIDDLMEMSKASTGNIQVEIATIDAVEAVTQALGEFTDKLTAAGLTPVFHQSEETIMLLADGRLLWRAMSNVLSNAVKYALPGTRLYVDVAATEDKVLISFKNISGAQLNISAEELMERFVRGDSSRNTEGSGLGLNIAKSLMELQKGQLQLLVDGDLFKVTLIFPRVN